MSGQVAGVREHHAAQHAQQGDRNEERGKAGMAGESNDVGFGRLASDQQSLL